VKENVTVLRTDRAGERHLVSYIVPAPQPSTTAVGSAGTTAHQLEKECKAFLRSRLPRYMVPRRVVVLQALPLTPNGKINRAALPDPFADQFDDDHEKDQLEQLQTRVGLKGKDDVVVVLSDTERGLLEIFAKLLGVNPLKIQLDDDFFELGGHSLLATQAIFHISQKLHVRLPINLLFQSPTIAGLSRSASFPHPFCLALGSSSPFWTALCALRHVDRIKQLGSSRVESETAEDLMAHAQALDPAIRFVAPPTDVATAEPPAHPTNAFITGATGFVGLFLLLGTA